MKVVILSHKNIDIKVLNDIIEIKNVAWSYSVEQHKQWIRENIKDKDLHILLYSDVELVGYCNLVVVNCEVEDYKDKQEFYGVGNVCTKYAGKGDGKFLMEAINTYLTSNDLFGVLFCKESLVMFYEKFNWNLVESIYPGKDIYTMVFNFKNNIINYNDRLF